MLIHRPVVGSTLQQKSSASLHAIRESSKCIIQIVQLLTERKLGFSFCLNKAQLLLLSGFALLYSTIECQQDGNLAKENQKLIVGMLKELEPCSPSLYKELRPIVASIVKLDSSRKPSISPLQVFRQEKIKEAPISPQSSPIELPSVRRRFSSIIPGMDARKYKNSSGIRRASTSAQDRIPSNMPYGNHNGVRLTSASLTDLAPSRSRYTPTPSSLDMQYLDDMWSLDTPNSSSASLPETSRVSMSTGDWERLLATMDATHAAHIYGDGGHGDSIISASASDPSGVPAGGPGAMIGSHTGARPVDQHWSLNNPREYPHSNDSGAPPSTSGFSTLSEESFDDDGGCGYTESEDLGDFLGPLMGAGSGGQGTLLEAEWSM